MNDVVRSIQRTCRLGAEGGIVKKNLYPEIRHIIRAFHAPGEGLNSEEKRGVVRTHSCLICQKKRRNKKRKKREGACIVCESVLL